MHFTYDRNIQTLTHITKAISQLHTQWIGWQRKFINDNREFVSGYVGETPDKATVHCLLQTHRSSTGTGRVFSVHVMKAYSGEEVQLQSFLISALDTGKWLTSSLGRFTPGSY